VTEFDELEERVERLEAVLAVMVDAFRTVITAYSIALPDLPLFDQDNPLSAFIRTEGGEAEPKSVT